jgi:hypothetical protein
LIQFGQSTAENQGRFGARETYHYDILVENDKPRQQRFTFLPWRMRPKERTDALSHCSVRYTRYGEGPPWYGPGRLCTLELSGKRVTDLSQVPQLAASIAAQRIPGFMSVHSPVAEQDTTAARAVDWFRGKGSAVLQITPDPDDEKSGWLQTTQERAWTILNRVKEATSMSVGGEK